MRSNGSTSTEFEGNSASGGKTTANWWQSAVSKVLNNEEPAKKPNTKVLKKQNSGGDSAAQEYRNLYEEFLKLKKILDIISNEYEESKSFDAFRRYQKMKGMIKRTIMYTKLDVIPDISSTINPSSVVMMTAGVRQKATQARIPECPKSELSSRIHLLKKRIAFIRSQIDQLAESYDNAKQYIPFQRYRLMKASIKQLLLNSIDLVKNQ